MSVSLSAGPAEVVGPATSRRRERFAAQRVLWRLSGLDRVRACGSRAVSGNHVQLRVSTAADGSRVGGFAGVQTCGSVWACPVCSGRILAERQGEIAAAVDSWIKGGGRVAFATFTVRHERGQQLEDVWNLVAAGHAAAFDTRGGWGQDQAAHGTVTDDRVWQTCDVAACGRRHVCTVASCGEDSPRGRRHALVCKGGQLMASALRHAPRCRIGTYVVPPVVPWVRVNEVTYGANGWHPHEHMLWFLPGRTTDRDLQGLFDRAWARFDAGVMAAGGAGGRQITRAVFVTGRDAADRIAGYVTKNTLPSLSAGQVAGLEVARGDLKNGRMGGRSMMQLLRDVVVNCELPEDSDRALWGIFERVSAGRRSVQWSTGARDLLGLTAERTDEEIAAEETGTVEDTVALLPAETYRAVAARPGRRAELLEAVERSTLEALELLDGWGVIWMPYRT